MPRRDSLSVLSRFSPVLRLPSRAPTRARTVDPGRDRFAAYSDAGHRGLFGSPCRPVFGRPGHRSNFHRPDALPIAPADPERLPDARAFPASVSSLRRRRRARAALRLCGRRSRAAGWFWRDLSCGSVLSRAELYSDIRLPNERAAIRRPKPRPRSVARRSSPWKGITLTRRFGRWRSILSSRSAI